MRGFSKKILISLLTTLVVFITVFATTYAWVGIFTYANTDSFKMNLKVQDLDSNYFLTISSSGKLGTFKNEIPLVELQRQVLKNRGLYYDQLDPTENNDKSNEVNAHYNRSDKINPCTALINDNKTLNFKKINLENYGGFELLNTTTDFIKFDIYLSVDTKEGITETTTGIKSNVYLTNIAESLEGVIKGYSFYNGNPFVELPSNPINDILKGLPTFFYLNNANATRFALSIYEPININDEYNNDSYPIETRIFQGGTQNPTYDSVKNVYNLGGCLPEDQNTALKELLYIRPNYKAHEGTLLRQQYEDSISYAYERNDLELIENNGFLWNKREHTEKYLGCMDGVQTKMKISVYFWFEGWDADCLRAIDLTNVALNLSFTSGTDD